jgi:hypothetical protein
VFLSVVTTLKRHQFNAMLWRRRMNKYVQKTNSEGYFMKFLQRCGMVTHYSFQNTLSEPTWCQRVFYDLIHTWVKKEIPNPIHCLLCCGQMKRPKESANKQVIFCIRWRLLRERIKAEIQKENWKVESTFKYG